VARPFNKQQINAAEAAIILISKETKELLTSMEED
jgi:hypothetical protein